jgi:predicted phage terminase large subunit-like protein
MQENYSKKEIIFTIDKILTAIEKNFKYSYGNKLTYEEICELVQNLDQLFEYLYNLDFVECGKIIRKRYIPLLNLLLQIDECMPNRIKYHNNLEKAYKLSGRTDLESFIIYYEWEEKDKFYEPRYEVLSGYCYYLNKMVFDPEFEGIVANLPSGWGKTYLTALASAFSYGVDDTGTILALCSNEDVVNGGSRTVKEIMQSDRYGDVFPNLKWNKEDKSYYSKDTESEWKLKDCKLSASYYARTTKSNVVGVRASKWVHIDDLYADYKEALNENDNIYYFNKFLTVWRKRFIQEAPIWKYIITGTMWSPKDFIVKIISWLEKRYKFVKHPKFKYVKVSDNGKFAIIQVPALNMKTGKSNCEALASTKTLLNEKASMDSYIFECNFQQNPVSPESMAFDWKNLKTYNTRLKNEYGATYSVIDGTRKSGKDFFSMPILQPYNGDYALIDCIYTQAATSKLYGAIVDKIITHNIKILVIETNVDGGLKTVIEKELKERGFNNGIQIIEKYSTVIKQTRIELEKGNIVDRIYYPDMSMLALNSDMGKFMTSFTMYNIEGNNVHDDANDSLGMFTSEIVAGKSKPQKARPIKRPF